MNLIYDIKNNTGSAKKVLGKTNYYVGVSKICARCGRTLTGYPALSRKDNKTEICSNCRTLTCYPALSRKDNKTEICSNCGTLEALEELIKYNKEKENGTINKN